MARGLKRRIYIDGDELAAKYLSGASSTLLAAEYGCSQPTIILRLKESGVTLRKGGGIKGIAFKKPIDLDANEIIRLYVQDKKSQREIGSIFGVSAPTITRVLESKGVARRHHNDTKRGKTNHRLMWADPQKIIDAYVAQEKNMSEICKELGCSAGWARRVLDAAGIKRTLGARNRFGKNNPNYRPNLTDEDRSQHRDNFKTVNWRISVFKRDGFACQKCGDTKGKNLQAHHLVPYSENKELRYEAINGITLCKNCHKEFHKTYGVKHSKMRDTLVFVGRIASECLG